MNYFTENELAAGSNFIMLVGAPASGKTTFANDLVDEYSATDHKFTIVSPDYIRRDLGFLEYRREDNSKVFAIVYERLTDLLDTGENVIYDATNCNRKDRNKIMHVIKGFYNKSVCLVSKTDFLTCCNRNDQRPEEYRKVPQDVLERMYISLMNNPPHIFEGYDVISRF
jgi:predicted kinase